jgi:hypothetical protein
MATSQLQLALKFLMAWAQLVAERMRSLNGPALAQCTNELTSCTPLLRIF